MRVKRQKQCKRIMALYHTSFGFREPYQVIADGTFVNVALSFRMNIEAQVPKVLLGESKLMTTPCIKNELYSLGQEFGPAIGASKNFELRRCHHKPYKSASDCIKELIGESNKHNYVVATQDPHLRSELRSIPGVPLLYLSNSILVLEPHSPATLLKANKVENGKVQVSEVEKKLLQKIAPLEKKENLKKPKKRKAKAPNPLSCRKPKKVKLETNIKGNDSGLKTKEEGITAKLKRTSTEHNVQSESTELSVSGNAPIDGTIKPETSEGGKKKRKRRKKTKTKDDAQDSTLDLNQEQVESVVTIN
ncbi:Fcf1-domain-containing protein [Paraphysoderma sedebokerense]|nr:Fcf1-domain-containing protein [Paraphysoderma sedebokerense]